MLPKYVVETQREHRVAFGSLLISTLVPMISAILGLGLWLKQIWPTPSVLEILAGFGAMLAAIPISMFAGAALWLLLARRNVSRDVARVFFVYPGVGPFSRISEWMFHFAYGADEINSR